VLRSVYCSGSIAKGAADTKRLCWTETEREHVRQGAAPAEVVFLNPDDPVTHASNTLGQFGRDMFQVMTATAVVVDARERRGIGIGVEMAAAASLDTPIIVVAPADTHYRRESLQYRGATVRNYVHPHVASLATAVVDDFVAAGRAVAGLPASRGARMPGAQWLRSAIDEYRNNVLPHDPPMQIALNRIDGAAMTSDARAGT
jgi:hypothetical protein